MVKDIFTKHILPFSPMNVGRLDIYSFTKLSPVAKRPAYYAFS